MSNVDYSGGAHLYQSALNQYLKKNKKKGKKRRPGTSLSIEDWARREVEKLIAAKVAQIESQRKIYLDELGKRSQLEMERGQALSQALLALGMPAQIKSIFGNAASDIAGLAQGFSGATRESASSQAAEQVNMLSGTGQEVAVRNQGENMGNVLYGVGGFLPAQSLTEAGASFGAQAALEPSFAQRIGQLEAGNVHREGLKGLDEFTQALVEARSQKPTMIQDLIAQRKGLAADERDAQRDWYLKLAALEMSRGNSKRADEYLRLSQGKEARHTAKDQGLDVNGNPLPGYRRNPKTGKVEKIPKNEQETPDWGDIQANMAEDADDFYSEVEYETFSGGTETKKVKFTYKEAYQALWAKYSGKVKNKGRLRRLINQILKAKGFKKTTAVQDYPR